MCIARAFSVALLCLGGGAILWPQHGDPSAAAMATAARALLTTLSPALREKATRALGDAERTQWNFVPGEYPGVLLKDLDDAQQTVAHALLRAALSARGDAKAHAVVQLETVLHEIESRGGRDAAHRDPGRYALLVFGDPSDDGT